MNEWIIKKNKFMEYLESINAFGECGYLDEIDRKSVEKDFVEVCRDYPKLTSLILQILDK